MQGSHAETKLPATAAQILAEAEATESGFGHSPRGFLSRSYGFLPKVPPLTSMAASHRAWDQAAAVLPELIATQRVRQELAGLPILSGEVESLAEGYLWRAALLLGYMAHAYVHSASEKVPLPDCIALPWTQTNRRLGRAHPGLTMSDYFCYNWTPVDPSGPRWVENMELLVAWFGNDTERVFKISTTEMHGRSGPLVDAAANLQDAVRHRDAHGAKVELVRLLDYIKEITFESMLKIDPNPYSKTFVDPLIWTKTWVPFSAPVNEHERGLGGSGTPTIQLLDAIFERTVHHTSVAQETLRLKVGLPSLPMQFIESFRHISLTKFVSESGDRELAGLLAGALDAYAGKRSFLSVHRLKVYGFMELGFKAGRTETNSGFSGRVADRAWDELDDTLEATRQERYQGKVARCPVATRTSHATLTENRGSPIHKVTLDIEGQGLKYVPGDRLGIFPRNSPPLIDRTLSALRATGREQLGLTTTWRAALVEILGEVPTSIDLATFLSYAKLRPLSRPAAKTLFGLSRCRRLGELLERREEDHLELWDAIEMLAAENYDVKRLWNAAPWEAESIVRIVPPESFRIYSISSAPSQAADEDSPHEVTLTVARLTFESQSVAGRPARTRQGTASGYLATTAEQPRAMPVRVFRPSRFQLPKEKKTPIVMFAGGSGISPFRGFLHGRAADAGPAWLFIGTRTFADLPYAQELAAWIGQGRLELRVAFSQEAKRLTFADGTFATAPGRRGHVDMLLEDEADSRTLWQMLQSRQDGGSQACFYICGQARFAHTVIGALKKVIARHHPGAQAGGDAGAIVDDFFRKLVAGGQLMLDIFTTFAPSGAASVNRFERYDASEIVRHNDAQHGTWIVVQGNVYDMSEFMYLHPGGDRLITSTAGTDATRSYEKAEHHLDSGVHALLDLYKIGSVRRLAFKDVWSIAVKPAGYQELGPRPTQENAKLSLIYVDLHEFYRRWVRLLYMVVETENSLNNNFSLRHRPLIRTEAPETMSKVKLRLLLDSHEVLYSGSWPQLLGVDLEALWNVTLGFCDHAASISALPQAIARARCSAKARQAESSMADIRTRLTALAAHQAEDPAGWRDLERDLSHLERCDRAFIAALKTTLRDGLIAFELHEHRVIEHGRHELISALERIPQLIDRYYHDLQRGA